MTQKDGVLRSITTQVLLSTKMIIRCLRNLVSSSTHAEASGPSQLPFSFAREPWISSALRLMEGGWGYRTLVSLMRMQ